MLIFLCIYRCSTISIDFLCVCECVCSVFCCLRFNAVVQVLVHVAPMRSHFMAASNYIKEGVVSANIPLFVVLFLFCSNCTTFSFGETKALSDHPD
jgi:hypothetical protein